MKLLCTGLAALAVPSGTAQTMDDGVTIPKRTIFAGTLYSHDAWDQYWEDPLERTNGNLGTVPTQAAIFTGNYGLTDRLNLLAKVPYVWARAGQGVLSGQCGIQDLTFAAKIAHSTSPSAPQAPCILSVSSRARSYSTTTPRISSRSRSAPTASASVSAPPPACNPNAASTSTPRPPTPGAATSRSTAAPTTPTASSNSPPRSPYPISSTTTSTSATTSASA